VSFTAAGQFFTNWSRYATPRRKRCLTRSALLMATTVLVTTASVASGQSSRTVTLGTPQRVPIEMPLSRIISAGVGADGRICLGDDIEVRITCVAATGAQLWSAGRRGGGPGELRSLYRIAVASDLSVWSFDVSSSAIDHFSAEGKWLNRHILPINFGQVLSLQVLGTSTLVLSGTAIAAGQVTDSAIHVLSLSDSVRHVRSFGRLPPTTDPRKQQMFGPGAVTITPAGNLLYSRRFPYEVSEFTPAGKLVRTAKGRVASRGPDAEIEIVAEGTKTRFSSITAKPGEHTVGPARALSPWWWIVSRRVGQEIVKYDVFDVRGGKWAPTLEMPKWEARLGVIGVDTGRSRLLASTTCDDEPCVVFVPFTVP
jgi:hypothetical protein